MKNSQKALLASMVTLSQGVTAMASPVRVFANTEPVQTKNTTVKKETANVPKNGYTFVSAPISEPVVENNTVTINHVNGEKTRITFLENNLFRLDMEPDGKDESFKEYATPNNSNHTGRIVQQSDSSSEYSKPTPTVTNEAGVYTIAVKDGVSLEVSKEDATMTLKRADGSIVWQESQPVQYKNGSTIQTFVKNSGENFFGGGTQNGRFIHTGESINIVNENNWVSGGVASPNPFFWSTNGYGVVRNTFKKGVYDFGKKNSNEVEATHSEKRLDAYYFVGDTPVSVLQGYFKLTGNPALFPEEAFYLGHLNCYNRDEWVEGGSTPLETVNDKVKYSEKNNGGQIKQGGVLESLNGTNETDYKFSARAVIDQYEKYDMQLGWFLPNDGYGCGYGTDDANLDNNIANLKSFTDYANSKGVGTGLWTQSSLTPDPNQPVHLQRDFEKEVYNGGIRTLKTDVAWVGSGYDFGLDGINKAYNIISKAETKNRPTIVTLDGWAGTQRYGGIWTGDQTGGNWEYIRFQIPTYIGQSLSGNPNVSSDVDGIFGGSSTIQARDIQWKTFTTMLLDMDGWGSYPKKPYVFGDETSSINRMYLKLRSQLMPYIYSTAYTSANLGEGNEKGKPQVRAMFLEFPEDTNTYSKNMQYQFMFGKDFLVAPVYQNTAADEAGNDIRNGIYLPDSNQVWIDYFTGKQYRGGTTLNNFDAPIWKMPLFVKNGAIIPMFEAHNNAATKTETNKGGVDKSKRLVEFYPDKESEYTQYEDEGNTVDNTNLEEVNYGSNVTTHYTSSVKDGKAVLRAEASQGSYNGYDANKETTFIVNVSKKPTALTGKVGSSKVELKEVKSQEEFDSATGNVYFYNKEPNLNKFATEGSEFEKTEIKTTPKLYVKFEKTNVSSNGIELTVGGFVNDGNLDKDELNENLQAPANFKADEKNITPTTIPLKWDAVSDATEYEVETDGMIQSGITETSYTHTDLEYHSKHTYRVRSRNKDGYSKWSDPIEVESALDPYRNVPKDIKVSWDYGDAWGKLSNILDFDYGTFFHSTNSVTEDQGLIYDLKKVYDLERIDYTPRNDNKGNGTVQRMDVYTSIDGVNWTLSYDSSKQKSDWTYSKDMSDLDTKTIDMTGTSARYIKYVVKKSKGGFFSAAELQPYIVDGSEGYVIGDTNNDGVIDENDATQIENYVGLEDGDPTWDQVKRSDYNKNGYYDAQDITQTMVHLDGGVKTPSKDPKGSLITSLDKTDYAAGETVTLTISGVDMKNVYSIGGKIGYNSDDLTFKGTSATLATANMREYKFDRIAYKKSEHNAAVNRNINFTYTNSGSKKSISGTKDVVTVTFTAKRDISLTPDYFNASEYMFVSNNLNAINPTVASEDIKTPDVTVSQIKVQSVQGQDESVLQSGMGVDKLIDGKWGADANRFEFKWGNNGDEVPARVPYWVLFNFDGQKTITDMTIRVRVDGTNINTGALKDFELYAVNGEEETKIGDYSITEVDSKQGFNIHFDAPVQAEKIKLNASNSQGGLEYKLNIDEVEFYQNEATYAEDIVFDENNASTIGVGQLKAFKATVLPENVTNGLYSVESDKPEVVSVIRTVDGDHYNYTLHAKKQGKAVLTITSNSTNKEGKKITKTFEINVVAGQVVVDDLKAQLDEANKAIENKNLYTTASIDALKAAVKNAEAVLKDKDATQTEVNAQTINLFKAIQALEYKGSNEGQPDCETEITIDPEKVTATSEATIDGDIIKNAFDGDENTIWHSNYNGQHTLPQGVTMDLGAEYDVQQLNYLPRPGSGNGDITKYMVETSLDGEKFKTVVVGTFEHDGSMLVNKGEFKKVKFDVTKARYVRFTALESLGNELNTYASAAEIKLFGALHEEAIPATSITLDKTELTLNVNETAQVKATLSPTETTDVVTWSSEDESIAKVDATGKITAVANGTVNIIAKANDQVQATVTVTVNAPGQAQLQQLIDEANRVKYENVVLQDALTKAIAKATDALNGDEQELQMAYYELAAEMSELELIQNNLDELNGFVQMDDSLYVKDEAFTLFKNKVEIAKNLMADPINQKELLKPQIKDLNDTYKLLTKLNREKLSAAIELAERVRTEDCVDNDELNAFKAALEAAKAADPANNEEIDTLVNALLDAQANLKYKQNGLTTQDQKDSIQYALDILKGLKLEDYSKEDQETIKAAIAKGEEALANPELDRDDANKVIKQLVKALAVKPKKDIDVPTTPDKPGTGSGTETKPGTGSGTETKPGTGSGSTTTKPGSGTTTTVNPSKGQSNANTGVENKAGLFGSLGVGAASLAGIATILYRKRENGKGLKKVKNKK